MNQKDIVVTRHEDGRTTIDWFPDETMIDFVLLADHQSEALFREGDFVYINVTNGNAKYRVVGKSLLYYCLDLKLAECVLRNDQGKEFYRKYDAQEPSC